MPFSFDDEAFEFVVLNCFAFFVLPQPLDVGGGEQFQDKPWLLGVWFGVDDDFIGGDVEVERIVSS